MGKCQEELLAALYLQHQQLRVSPPPRVTERLGIWERRAQGAHAQRLHAGTSSSSRFQKGACLVALFFPTVEHFFAVTYKSDIIVAETDPVAQR